MLLSTVVYHNVLADVIAMWYMAINAFVTDAIVTFCGIDPV